MIGVSIALGRNARCLLSGLTPSVLVSSSLLLTLLCGVATSLANDVRPLSIPYTSGQLAEDSTVDILGVLWAFCVTVIIEYLVIRHFLKGRLRLKSGLFLWVFLVNVLTNPAAQAVFWSVGTWSYREVGPDALLAMLFAVELAVVVVEFALLKCIFTNMYRGGALYEPITTGRTIMIALTANVASLVCGFVSLILAM